jgi:zinc transporter ZupT
MLGHVEVDGPPAMVSEHDEDEEDAEPSGGHGEEVERDQVSDMIGEDHTKTFQLASSNGTAIALSVVAPSSTFIGGLVALRATATLRYFFAFSAGTLLAMALADLLPEAMALSSTTPGYRVVVCYVILASFVLFHIVERYVLVHHVHDDQREATSGAQAHTESHTAGGLGASGLVVHSILDGVVIGAASRPAPMSV